ncbi:MAG TPA: hypothetical protein PKM73_13940 [Verrucomicrobiota bacterium]|nr:hypothetical protein [Verrucomicrobiota bacterium]HNU52571.1 hypothetical protein [Verrucomicrobiota bacterium]
MNEIRIACPRCGQHVALQADWAGKTVECPACQQVFLVPGPGAPEGGGTAGVASSSAQPGPMPERLVSAEPSEGPSRRSGLEGIIRRLRGLTGTRDAVVDTSQFGDPLASAIDWTPLAAGGASFCTHKLVAVGGDRVEFRASLGARLFSLLFLGFGLGMIVLWVLITAGVVAEKGEGPLIVLLLGGVVFLGAGVFLLRSMLRPVVFDKASGYFWKTWRNPSSAAPMAAAGDYTQLERIRAIQLVSERCRSGGKHPHTYYSYELNLVLDDGTRRSVVDHGNKARILEDAQTLAAFLGVRVWDAT